MKRMSMRLEGYKLALTIISLVLTVLVLASTLAFNQGILAQKVDGNREISDQRWEIIGQSLNRINDKLDNSCHTVYAK